MLWIIVGIIAFPLILYSVFKYFDTGTEFWPKRGVKLITFSEISTLPERLLLQSPVHELDTRFYKKIKNEKLQFGGTEEFRNPVFVPADLDLLRNIFVKDFEYFVNRRSFEAQRTDKNMRDMLLMKQGQEWKDLRSTMTPTFTTGKIRRMFQVFNQSSSNFVKFVENMRQESNEVDLKECMGRYTMDVIASSALGVDSKLLDKDSHLYKMGRRFQNAFTGVLGILKLILLVFFPKLGTFFGIQFSDKLSTEFFFDVIRKSKDHRLKSGERREDFLQLMIDAQGGNLKSDEADNYEDSFEKDAKLSPGKANKIKITDKLLEAQCLLFLIGGFDTTETLLVFTAYELAVNPDMQEKLAKEIDDKIKKNNGEFTYDAIIEMEYLDMFISETLRKYPPGFRTERKSLMDYKIPNSDVILPKDVTVLIPVWGIHHDPEYYPDPEKFDPERFSAENKATRHPFAYLPFGAGPRNCIAMRFALMQSKTVIAKLVHNFILEPSSKTPIPMKFERNANLKPEGGMRLIVKRRRNKGAEGEE